MEEISTKLLQNTQAARRRNLGRIEGSEGENKKKEQHRMKRTKNAIKK